MEEHAVNTRQLKDQSEQPAPCEQGKLSEVCSMWQKRIKYISKWQIVSWRWASPSTDPIAFIPFSAAARGAGCICWQPGIRCTFCKSKVTAIPEKQCFHQPQNSVTVILGFVCCYLRITKHHLFLIFFSLSTVAVSCHSPERKTRLAINFQVIPSICQQAPEATATSVPKSNPWATAALWLHPWPQHQMPARGSHELRWGKRERKKKASWAWTLAGKETSSTKMRRTWRLKQALHFPTSDALFIN